MKKLRTNKLLAAINPNAILLFCVIVIVFFLPALPVAYHQFSYSFLYSCIFLFSVLSLKHVRKKFYLWFALFLFLLVWISFEYELPYLSIATRVGKALFFLFVVIQLIKQTAKAKIVNLSLIADAITGYLLVGVLYTIATYSIVLIEPEAFNFAEGPNSNKDLLMSKMFYYTFITYTSTGYGEITPALPAARSFATFISASGQLYVAVIIALLVGKFSSIGDKND